MIGSGLNDRIEGRGRHVHEIGTMHHVDLVDLPVAVVVDAVAPSPGDDLPALRRQPALGAHPGPPSLAALVVSGQLAGLPEVVEPLIDGVVAVVIPAVADLVRRNARRRQLLTLTRTLTLALALALAGCSSLPLTLALAFTLTLTLALAFTLSSTTLTFTPSVGLPFSLPGRPPLPFPFTRRLDPGAVAARPAAPVLEALLNAVLPPGAVAALGLPLLAGVRRRRSVGEAVGLGRR